jgi:hypothetical protein
MHPAADILMAHSHQQDLLRAAATSGRRAEARRAAVKGLNPRRSGREIVLRPSPFRRLVTRFAA